MHILKIDSVVLNTMFDFRFHHEKLDARWSDGPAGGERHDAVAKRVGRSRRRRREVLIVHTAAEDAPCNG